MKNEILLKNIESHIKYFSNNGFPEINYSEISVYIVKNDNFFMASKNFNLYVSTDCLKLNELALKGVLAHELVHIINYKTNPILELFRSLLYLIPKLESYLERNTDREVIRRGYGVQLLEFVKFHDKYYKKYKTSDGLTKKEIKNILKKIG